MEMISISTRVSYHFYHYLTPYQVEKEQNYGSIMYIMYGCEERQDEMMTIDYIYY